MFPLGEYEGGLGRQDCSNLVEGYLSAFRLRKLVFKYKALNARYSPSPDFLKNKQ